MKNTMKENAPPVCSADGAIVKKGSERNIAGLHQQEEARRRQEASVAPSWRDFYDTHPAAAFFHTLSSDEQLEELAEDIAKQKVIFNSIHTASVFGKLFVIDGISRLDAIEKTGRMTVDEKGNWI